MGSGSNAASSASEGNGVSRGADKGALAMAGALVAMGALHFARPKPFDGLIPPELPFSRRSWTYGSGVAELGVAGLLAVPRTRKLGALSAVILFIGVFPGNLHMVRAWKRKPFWPWRAIAWARLPMQVPMVLAAWRIRQRSGR